MAGLNEWAKTLLEGRHYAMLATRNAAARPTASIVVDVRKAQFFGGLLSATPQKWFRPVD